MDIASRLRRKFICTAMGSVTLVLTLIVGGINVVNYHGVVDRTEARLDLIAREGEDGRQASAAPTRPDAPRPHGISAETPFDVRFFTVTLDSSGGVTSMDMSNIAAVDERQAEQMATDLWRSGRTEGFSSEYRFRMVAAEPEGGSDDASRTYLFLDCTRELGQFDSFLRASIAISGAGLALVCALVALLSGLAIKPIADSYDKQRRFVTDASHELKTPLSVIDANTEVIEMTEGESEWTRGIHEQVARMSRLTERLVFLARMDEGDELEMGECDLSEVAKRAIEPYHAVALSANKRLSSSVDDGVCCRGDAAAIAQAICLLLDNAMRYAREESVVEVSVRTRDHACRIDVSNAFDELPKGDLDVLFERFYRSDESRARETGGSGIGLSVVRAIAEAHHGKALCTTDGVDTITFSLILRQ